VGTHVPFGEDGSSRRQNAGGSFFQIIDLEDGNKAIPCGNRGLSLGADGEGAAGKRKLLPALPIGNGKLQAEGLLVERTERTDVAGRNVDVLHTGNRHPLLLRPDSRRQPCFKWLANSGMTSDPNNSMDLRVFSGAMPGSAMNR